MASGPKHSLLGGLAPTEGRIERLLYLADMMSELQQIAAREGCVTIAGLLALASVDAQRQIKKGKGEA